MFPRNVFWILTPKNLLSRVYESIRQDIFGLSKTIFQISIGKLKVFTNIQFTVKNLIDSSVKRWKPVWTRAWTLCHGLQR